MILQHEQLHRILWGPASRDGRTKRSDILVYVQLILVAALAFRQLGEYDKPVAARLAALGAAYLLYFRSVALFIRLILLLSAVVVIGDVLMPLRQFIASGSEFSLNEVPLAVYAFIVINNIRIVYAIVRALPKSARKVPVTRRSLVGKAKAL